MSNQLNGPYVPIDSVFSFTTFTTTITGVNANTASLYFYIKTREGCCSQYSVASDTLRSIRMIVTALSNEVVRLNWNRIHNPPLPSTGSAYTLYKDCLLYTSVTTSNNPEIINVTPGNTTTYSLTTISDDNCPGLTSGTAQVVVCLLYTSRCV